MRCLYRFPILFFSEVDTVRRSPKEACPICVGASQSSGYAIKIDWLGGLNFREYNWREGVPPKKVIEPS